MATTSITIRIDENLKKQAEILFEDMGLNMTTAFTIFTKAVVRQHKIPFEISAVPINEENPYHIHKAAPNQKSSKSMNGLHVLQSFAGTLPGNFDYEQELEEARKEKYDRLN